LTNESAYRLIVKMSQDEFRAALAPVLADLERDHPSLLRVEELPDHPDLHAYLWDSTGAGTGVYLSDASEGAELVADAADKVQDAAFEALWREGKSTSWPSCPHHPDTHPLAPGAEAGQAVWWCQVNAETAGIIGSLRRS
jgi:hypothetical protein